ncbi:hypothetical protein EC841_102111 [Raoultella ornithinolytica]|uniref:Uncharacterized protein n=2 Tax=Raoultella TaxID=160674 RepID=A0A380SP96_RAOTE|nr:hypothetical protein EDF76_0237 [Raoultella terrigena]TCQ75005.1 hypothetical protein EC841_102111 [Raoultella ornithinolytica]TDQ26099.1 hypothetical protein EDF75_0119 [Raoultella sp. BIGb0149]ROS26469.1 hypothetical protein EDF79_0436 [Raoultella terrigena]SUQ59503.1 Uncharacterised protein [Raoultella terrigena]
MRPCTSSNSLTGSRSVDRVFQRFTSTETRNFSSGNSNFFTCLRVATGTGSTLFNSKSTKTYQRNVIPSLQRFSNRSN